MEYDAIISLGAACKTAANIRRYFGNDRAFPFDWWITRPHGVGKILRADFHGMMNPQFLERRTLGDADTVYDHQFEVTYHHEFPRDEAGKIVADYQRHIPRRLERLRALAERMNRICSTSRVLFVRQEAAAPEAEAAARAVAIQWLGLFREKWPQGHADLLLLDAHDVRDTSHLDTGTVYFDRVPIVTEGTTWQIRGYTELFDRWGFVSNAPKSENLRLNFMHDEAA